MHPHETAGVTVSSTGLYFSRKLRTTVPKQILIALCSSLLALYIIFLVFMSLRETSITGCGFMAGLLHFSLLCAMSWMAVEGLNIYMLVIVVFDQGKSANFMTKAIIFATGELYGIL